MTRLFHVSETPDIAVFEPRPVPSPDAGVTGDAVWAIGEEHLPNYLWPRDCPRVTYRAGPGTAPDDIATFIGASRARRIIALEEAWRDRIAVPVHVYEMPSETFVPADASAGYFISRQPVTPISVIALCDPLRAVAERGCEVRFVPNLWPLRDAVVASTLDYSIIRMRNAARTP